MNYTPGEHPNPTVVEIHKAKILASSKIESIIKDLVDELGLFPNQFKLNMNHSGSVWIDVIL